jgi:hypothetical protein
VEIGRNGKALLAKDSPLFHLRTTPSPGARFRIVSSSEASPVLQIPTEIHGRTAGRRKPDGGKDPSVVAVPPLRHGQTDLGNDSSHTCCKYVTRPHFFTSSAFSSDCSRDDGSKRLQSLDGVCYRLVSVIR